MEDKKFTWRDTVSILSSLTGVAMVLGVIGSYYVNQRVVEDHERRLREAESQIQDLRIRESGREERLRWLERRR